MWTGTGVTDIQDEQVVLGHETIDAGTVLWAAGVAAVPLGRTLGVPLDPAGRVRVEPDLTIPGHPDVYVVGDLATMPGADGRPLPGVIQVALQQARHAVRNIHHTLEGQPRDPFGYHDLGNMATIGRNSAVCDLNGVKLQGYFAWWFWLLFHIYKLIGFRNRLDGDDAVGVLVHDLSAIGAADHGRGAMARYSLNAEPVRFWIIAPLLALALFFVPAPPWVVDKFYSRDMYPWLQTWFTSASNLVPFAVLDVLILLVTIAVGWRLIRLFNVTRERGVMDALWEGFRRTVRGVSIVALLFLWGWGCNYRRMPIEKGFPDGQVQAPTADVLKGAISDANALASRLRHATSGKGLSYDEVAAELPKPMNEALQLVGRPAPQRTGTSEVLDGADAVLHARRHHRHGESVRARVDRPPGPVAVRTPVRGRARVGASGRAGRRSRGQRRRLAGVHARRPAPRLQRQLVSDCRSGRGACRRRSGRSRWRDSMPASPATCGRLPRG